jgi:hypothetical protein
MTPAVGPADEDGSDPARWLRVNIRDHSSRISLGHTGYYRYPSRLRGADLLAQTFSTTQDPAARGWILGESFSGCLLTRVFDEGLLLLAGQGLAVPRAGSPGCVVQVRTRKEVGADHPQTAAAPFVLPSISAAVSLDADLASIAPRVQPVPLHFSYPFVGLPAMRSGVAGRAQRDQVLLGVFPRMTAEFPVVHLKIRHRATGLTPPVVATQDLLAQTFVR